MISTDKRPLPLTFSGELKLGIILFVFNMFFFKHIINLFSIQASLT